MLPCLALLLAAGPAHAADDSFHPNAGPERLSLAELTRTGQVLGRTGRLLVRADDAAALSTLPEVAEVRTLPGGLLRVTPAEGVDDLALSRALHARADVTWAHPDLILDLQVATLPDDPFVGDEWHLENTGQGGRTEDVDIDAEGAWAYATGAEVIIAVLDSGVATDHPDLSVIPGYDYVSDDGDPNPDYTDTWSGPHGTAAAGVAAATGNNGYGVAGVAYDADVYAIRLIGGESTTEGLYDAFVEAVDAGASVLSNSWGFGTDCTGIPNLSVFDDMFQYAELSGRDGLGALVVFAAGNGGCNNDSDGMLEHRKLIVVAALESDDARASYSNYGDSIDIAAPTSLLTTDLVGAGYGSYGDDDAFSDGFSGTSAATPVVAGVVALMVEANPRAEASDIRKALCATAVRNDIADAAYDDEGWSPYYGCGRVDAGAAVAAVANGAPAAPVARLFVAQTYEGRAILAWEPAADPDEDVLGYEVAWWREPESAPETPNVTTTGTQVDIGAELAVGDTVLWKVRAIDPWGEGPWSATTELLVVPAPIADSPPAPRPEPKGCLHTAQAGWLALLLAVGGLTRRRL